VSEQGQERGAGGSQNPIFIKRDRGSFRIGSKAQTRGEQLNQLPARRPGLQHVFTSGHDPW
jgi:hypothetical protein